MIRPLVSLVAGALAFAAAADLHETPFNDEERAAMAEACAYYDMRARAARMTEPSEFVVFLADACAAAEQTLADGTPEQRGRSALLLARIALLRRTVAAMNAERATDSAGRNRAGQYVPVSPSGEFLIAHRLGVLVAFDAWLDTGVQFSVASYP